MCIYSTCNAHCVLFFPCGFGSSLTFSLQLPAALTDCQHAMRNKQFASSLCCSLILLLQVPCLDRSSLEWSSCKRQHSAQQQVPPRQYGCWPVQGRTHSNCRRCGRSNRSSGLCICIASCFACSRRCCSTVAPQQQQEQDLRRRQQQQQQCHHRAAPPAAIHLRLCRAACRSSSSSGKP